MTTSHRSPWVAFVRLWFVMFFSFFTLKFSFNLAVMGWIDARPTFLLELLIIPLGQSLAFWFVTRRARREDGPVQPAAAV